MLKFTIVSGKLVLDPNIVLFKELHDVYKLKQGEKLLQVIYFTHSRDVENPFRDLDSRTIAENVMRAVFNKSEFKDLKLVKADITKFDKAEKLFIKHNLTAEGRLEAAIDKKLDEISEMLNITAPTIEEFENPVTGEIKFNTNLTIMINLFSKIESIMKSKTVLQNTIRKQENEGRTKGGGTTSFREMGVLK